MNSPRFPFVPRRVGRLGLMLPGVFLCIASGCDLPGRPKPSDRWEAPQLEKSFDVLYRRNCAGCHGADGKLGPAPPLNDKLFLALVPDDELKRVVSLGRPGTLMPPFAADKGGQLTAEQVLAIAQGIKPRWARRNRPRRLRRPRTVSKTKCPIAPAQGLLD